MVVKVDVFVPNDWKKISKEEELDLVDQGDVADHIINECDYRFELVGERIGHISETEIVGQSDSMPIV